MKPTRLTCYVIPGLGATEELFANIYLPDWIDIRPVRWEPCCAREDLATYARRLLPQVDPEIPHFFLGFSFGAAVAVELALLTSPLLTVIVSGVARTSEIPFYLRRIRALGIYNLAPWIVRVPTPLLRWGAGFSFGTRNPESLDLLVQMIRSIDPSFYECGLKAFMGWKNDQVPQPLIHIHGSRDRLLPKRYVQPEYVIPGGGHFIIHTHGAQISALIDRTIRRVLTQKNSAVASADLKP